MSPRGTRPTTSKLWPKRGGEQSQKQPKPTQLRATPPWANSISPKKTPRESGLKVAYLGCGRTSGGSPRAQPSLGGSYRLSLVSSNGFGGTFNAKGGLLLPYEEIQGIFQGIHPSSPPIKGGPLPPHSNNTPRQELHHKSITLKGLGPS
jgi:hypothetical protein